jgi:hypothetical protein
MFKSLSVRSFLGTAAIAVLVTGCGSNNNNSIIPTNGQGGAYGYGTSCLTPYSSSLQVGFSAPQVSLTTTQLSFYNAQASGGGYTQGQFTKNFYGGQLYLTVTGLPQYSGQPTSAVSAQGSINVSGSLVETWKYQLGMSFGWGSGYGTGYGGQYQQYPQFCVQSVSMNLVVNPTMVNPQIYSGQVQFRLQTGQTLPGFLI